MTIFDVLAVVALGSLVLFLAAAVLWWAGEWEWWKALRVFERDRRIGA